MSSGITLTRSFRPKQSSFRRKRQSQEDQEPKRTPRITRLMALAIYFEQMIDDGVVADQAEIARLGCVSRARVTQIMNLLNLAPDIKEQILFWQDSNVGRTALSERNLRQIIHKIDWTDQRKLWHVRVKPSTLASTSATSY